MVETTTRANQIRAFAASERCFTRKTAIDKFGDAVSNQLPAMVRAGELDTPARGVYCLPGVHIDDPQLVALLTATGGTLYPPEKRQQIGAAAERAATKRIRQAVKRDQPRQNMLAFAKQHQIFSVAEVRDQLGAKMATLATTMAQEGRRIVVVQPGIYALIEVAADEAALQAYFDRHSEQQRSITMEIDEYRRRYEQMPHLGTGGVTVNYWDNGSPATETAPAKRATLLRVYINIPGFPSIYGQATRSKGISWKAKGGEISDAAAAALAAKVFDPVPVLFSDLMTLVHDPAFQPRERIRTGGYADFRPQDDDHLMFRCAYKMGEVRRLDPTKLSKPLPEPVTLLVDHREPDSIVTALRRVPNLTVVRTELEHGDYLVPDRMIFERKTTDDFHASLQGTQRLISQACAVHALGLKTTLIIEGGVWSDRRMPLNKLYSTLSWLRYDKAHDIVESANEQFTCYLIVQAIKHYVFGITSDPRRPDPVKKREAAWSRRDQQIFGIRGWMTGISEKRAAALLDHFGSPAAIAAASVEQLMEINGIGRSLAEDLYAILH